MAKTDLMKRILKTSKSEYADTLLDSPLLDRNELISTSLPALNIALSGDVDGGFDAGIVAIGGKSKHFKTLFSLHMAASYLNLYKDAVLVFFDSEFGSPREYFSVFGDNQDRIIHIPITTVEGLRTELINQLKDSVRGDHVIYIVDSVGNLASIKETVDAIDGKQTVDMTRAKMIKSLFRLVTPQLNLKHQTLITINHTYQTLEMFSKEVMSGGCLVDGVEILMHDGSSKEIQDVQVGDAVMTYQGDGFVSHTWTPETLDVGEPECFEVEFEDGHTIQCSASHKFMVNNEWVECSDLRIGLDVDTI